MTNSQRLDNIENDLETVKQLLISTARYAESANQGIEQLNQRQDLTQRQLDRLSVSVQALGEKIDNFVDTTSDFVETTKARNAVMDGVITRLEESQISTNAVITRLEESQISTNVTTTRLEESQISTNAAITRLEESQISTNAAIASIEAILRELLRRGS
jgi:chromosome segregation ATPase